MRISFPGLGLIMACSVAAFGGIPVAGFAGIPAEVIHLDDPAALAHLRATNPGHYARAERILAAANQLCRPGTRRLYPARFGAQDFTCERMLLKTSNPPKRYVTFRLDQTRYAALVPVTDDPPRLIAAK